MKKNAIKMVIPMMMISVAFFCCGIEKTFAVGSGTGTAGGKKFENPISAKNVDELLGNVLGVIQKMVAGLAVLMIVVGGIMYITSAGGAQAEAGKKTVTAALIGLAIVLAAPSFLKEIYGVLGGGPTGVSADKVTAAKSLSQIIISTLKVLLGLIGSLSVLMLVVGGVMYITSGGTDRADTGRKIVVNAIIGLVIAILSLVMVTAIAGLF